MTMEDFSRFCTRLLGIAIVFVGITAFATARATGAGIVSPWPFTNSLYASHFIIPDGTGNVIDEYAYGSGGNVTSGFLPGFYKFYEFQEYLFSPSRLLPHATVSADITGTFRLPQGPSNQRPEGLNTAAMSAYQGNGTFAREILTRASTAVARVSASEGLSYKVGSETINPPIVTHLDLTNAVRTISGSTAPYFGLRYDPNDKTSAHFNALLTVTDDPLSVLRYGVQSKLKALPNDPNFSATLKFTNSAGQDVPLSKLAGALELKGFNWISKVVHFPESWTHKEVWKDVYFAPGVDDEGLPVTQFLPLARYVSSPVGHWVHSADSPKAGQDIIAYPVSTGMNDLPPLASDSFNTNFVYTGANGEPFFWKSAMADTKLVQDEYDYYLGIGQLNQTNTEIIFADRPMQGVGAMLPGEYLQFRAELVGIKQDLSPLHTGVFVTYKSNAVTNKRGGTFDASQGTGGTLRSDRAGYVSGGIFDAEVMTVPEMRSSIQAIIAIAYGFRFVRRISPLRYQQVV